MARIRSHFALSSEGLPQVRWDLAIVGSIVDDRGADAVEYARSRSRRTIELHYMPDTLAVELDGAEATIEQIRSVVEEAEAVCLETTTLGFVESFLVLQATTPGNKTEVGMLYVEPHEYRSRERQHVLNRRSFDLTNEVRGFTGIPGATFMVRSELNTRAVFLLGYEGQRLDQLIEQVDLNPSLCCAVFGIPAFQAGWEMDAFANNVVVIKERGIRDIRYAGANDPSAAYEVLSRQLRACDSEDRLLIAPIGTKPHGLGAALFAAEHPEVALVYDHPDRSRGRSSLTGTWHLHFI